MNSLFNCFQTTVLFSISKFI